MTETRTASRATEAHSAIYAKGFAALHIFTGLVWLTNGLAKVFNKSSYDLGFRSFSLISRDGAMPIAHRASDATQIDFLVSCYHDIVVANWGTLRDLPHHRRARHRPPPDLRVSHHPHPDLDHALADRRLLLGVPGRGPLAAAAAGHRPRPGATGGLDRGLAPRMNHRWPF